ncbi:pilus assembly protein [Streptomyces coryli]|uniref:pilus assembly protein n=1 Tax=Streptomyces coryli TaxID=1128680 RepID=UPI0030B90349
MIIEFAGMVPIILVTLVVLWQLVLVGYTFILAGNSADEAARAAATAEWYESRQEAARTAAIEDLPKAWAGPAEVPYPESAGNLWKVKVHLKVPVLAPGLIDFPFTITGSAGAAQEG